MRKTILLKDNWQFRKSASRKWTPVRVPHDFAIMENFDRNSDNTFIVKEFMGKRRRLSVLEIPEGFPSAGGLSIAGKLKLNHSKRTRWRVWSLMAL